MLAVTASQAQLRCSQWTSYKSKSDWQLVSNLARTRLDVQFLQLGERWRTVRNHRRHHVCET
jgi:hypothetical protein